MFCSHISRVAADAAAASDDDDDDDDAPAGYPFDIPEPGAGLQAYCMLIFHMVLLIPFSAQQVRACPAQAPGWAPGWAVQTLLRTASEWAAHAVNKPLQWISSRVGHLQWIGSRMSFMELHSIGSRIWIWICIGSAHAMDEHLRCVSSRICCGVQVLHDDSHDLQAHNP